MRVLSLALFPDLTLPMCAEGEDVSGEVTGEGTGSPVCSVPPDGTVLFSAALCSNLHIKSI